jgi:hypothetical protein
LFGLGVVQEHGWPEGQDWPDGHPEDSDWTSKPFERPAWNFQSSALSRLSTNMAEYTQQRPKKYGKKCGLLFKILKLPPQPLILVSWFSMGFHSHQSRMVRRSPSWTLPSQAWMAWSGCWSSPGRIWSGTRRIRRTSPPPGQLLSDIPMVYPHHV